MHWQGAQKNVPIGSGPGYSVLVSIKSGKQLLLRHNTRIFFAKTCFKDMLSQNGYNTNCCAGASECVTISDSMADGAEETLTAW